jgi:hypothetical protein
MGCCVGARVYAAVLAGMTVAAALRGWGVWLIGCMGVFEGMLSVLCLLLSSSNTLVLPPFCWPGPCCVVWLWPEAFKRVGAEAALAAAARREHMHLMRGCAQLI